jgi:hypothetical protein
VPIYYGASALYRRGGTSLALLDVVNRRLAGPVELGVETTAERSHVTVARAQHVVGANRVGVIAMNQTQPWGSSAYRAYGTDGQLALLKSHLQLSGFVARSDKLETADGLAGPASRDVDEFDRLSDNAWMAAARWQSQDVEASASYIDVGRYFRGDLGFFERTGVRRSNVAAFYRPQIQNDLVRAAAIGTSMSRLWNWETDGVLFTRLSQQLEIQLLDRATIAASLTQARDVVSRIFYVAGHRIGIVPGDYTGLVSAFSLLSAPRQWFQLGVRYEDGAYFGGQQRILTPEASLNLGIVAARVLYQRFYIHPGPAAIAPLPYPDEALSGDRLSARLLVAPTPDLRLSAAVELNTLDPAATTQLVLSWRIDGLSNLILVANRSAPGIDPWAEEPAQRALIKFSYGIGLP